MKKTALMFMRGRGGLSRKLVADLFSRLSSLTRKLCGSASGLPTISPKRCIAFREKFEEGCILAL